MEQLIVDTQGSRLHKDGERLAIEQEGQTVQSVPLGSLRQLVVVGRGVNASTPLLYELVRRGVDVVYQSQAGRFGFRLVGPASKHSALRVQQILTVTDPARALPLARAVVAGKLHNQAVVLYQYRQALGEQGKQAMAVLVEQVRSAAQALSVDELRGHEGSGAAAYFGAWPGLFDAQAWRFAGRAYYPPPDPVNALLSFGYTLLLHDVQGAVYRIGLDPDVGFFHALDYGRPSLALDIEEEFRPALVDRLVLRLVRAGALQPSDFQPAEEGPGAVMSDDARRLFLQCYEEQLGVRLRYQALEQNLTYRQIIDRQVEHLARCILGRDKTYVPLLIR
jgi:CRISPR-associated protein Cas1